MLWGIEQSAETAAMKLEASWSQPQKGKRKDWGQAGSKMGQHKQFLVCVGRSHINISFKKKKKGKERKVLVYYYDKKMSKDESVWFFLVEFQI